MVNRIEHANRSSRRVKHVREGPRDGIDLASFSTASTLALLLPDGATHVRGGRVRANAGFTFVACPSAGVLRAT